MVFSFVLAYLFNADIFIASSPQIHPLWKNNLISRFSPIQWARNAQIAEYKEEIQKETLETVSPGVYAREYETVSETVIRLGEMEFVEYPVEIEGKTIFVKIPR